MIFCYRLEDYEFLARMLLGEPLGLSLGGLKAVVRAPGRPTGLCPNHEKGHGLALVRGWRFQVKADALSH